MAYLDIRKDGKLVSRRLVAESAAEKGVRWKLGATEYQMTLGETARVGDYELVLLAGDPPARKKAPAPARSQDKLAAKTRTGTFAAINPQMMDAEDVLDLAGDPNVPKVDGYEIKGRIGDGGMGTVWRAIQLSTKREVALKFLQERKLHSTKAQIRFEREVQLCARLEHPNIARIYDSGLSKGVYYYALELIHGESLDDYAAMTGLNQKQILELMAKVCGAVQYAHAHGVIHRDLKPSNILVSEDGQPHVLDFGLAKSLLEDDKDLTISKEGDIAGTPAFMAPEQAAGHAGEITAKTDVYALGIILYKLALKHHPHDLTGPHYEVIRRIAEEEVVNPRDIDKKIDPELSAILLKSLAHNPDDRYVTAGEMGKDLACFLSGEPLLAQELTATYMIRRKFRKHRGKILMLAGVAAAFIAGIVITAISLQQPSDPAAVSGRDSATDQPQPRTIATKTPPVVVVTPASQGSTPSIAKTDTQPAPITKITSPETQPVFVNTTVDWTKIVFEKNMESSRIPEPQLRFSPAAEVPQQNTNTSPGRTATEPAAIKPVDDRILTLDLGNNVSMKLAPIPSGKFIMGSPDNEKGRIHNEGPQHEVVISKPFFMGVYSVTQGQWKAVMNSEPWKDSKYLKEGADYAVIVVWDSAAEFCRKLSQKTGKTVRLPTEAEREYACRAGSQTRFYFGDDESVLGEYAWFSGNAIADERVHKVGQKKPNAWGLYDMLGNAPEWCLDGFREYDGKPQTDPRGTTSLRVKRGLADYPRSAHRTITRNDASTGGVRVIVENGEASKTTLSRPDTMPQPYPAVTHPEQGSPDALAQGKETVVSVDPNKGLQNTGVDIKEGRFYCLSVSGFWSSGQGKDENKFGPEGPLPNGVQPNVLEQPLEDSLQGGIGGNESEAAKKYKIHVLRNTLFLAPASGKLFLGRPGGKNKLAGEFRVTISEIPNPWPNADTFAIRAKIDKTTFLHIRQDGVFWEYGENAQAGQPADNGETYPTLINNVMWWPVRQAGQQTSCVLKDLKILPEKGKLLAILQSSQAGKDNLVKTARLNEGCVTLGKAEPEEIVFQFTNQQDSKWLEGVVKLLSSDFVPATTQPSPQGGDPRPYVPPNHGTNKPPLGPDGKPIQPGPGPGPRPPPPRK
ncbi:MAG: SUMF1/EgtB/PvdO family nonheme iron enzyme [Planctomycetes bacterium]|nr:SUMF1/EgtB/PvdO family nonheme iron enzyme [Planctomycetota bacterium]